MCVGGGFNASTAVHRKHLAKTKRLRLAPTTTTDHKHILLSPNDKAGVSAVGGASLRRSNCEARDTLIFVCVCVEHLLAEHLSHPMPWPPHSLCHPPFRYNTIILVRSVKCSVKINISFHPFKAQRAMLYFSLYA